MARETETFDKYPRAVGAVWLTGAKDVGQIVAQGTVNHDIHLRPGDQITIKRDKNRSLIQIRHKHADQQ